MCGRQELVLCLPGRGEVSWVFWGRPGACSNNNLSLVCIYTILVGNYVPRQHYLDSSLEEAQCSANQQNPTTNQPSSVHVCWTLECPGRKTLHCSGVCLAESSAALCACVRRWTGRDNKINAARLEGLGTSHSIILSSSLIVLPLTCFPLRRNISSLLALVLFPLSQVYSSESSFQKVLSPLQWFHKYLYFISLYRYMHCHAALGWHVTLQLENFFTFLWRLFQILSNLNCLNLKGDFSLSASYFTYMLIFMRQTFLIIVQVVFLSTNNSENNTLDLIFCVSHCYCSRFFPSVSLWIKVTLM